MRLALVVLMAVSPGVLFWIGSLLWFIRVKPCPGCRECRKVRRMTGVGK